MYQQLGSVNRIEFRRQDGELLLFDSANGTEPMRRIGFFAGSTWLLFIFLLAQVTTVAGSIQLLRDIRSPHAPGSGGASHAGPALWLIAFVLLWVGITPWLLDTDALLLQYPGKVFPEACWLFAAAAITTEMIPLLAAKFPIDTTQLGLSAGGFFTSWVIFQPNTPFNKYIVSSPAMSYGHGEIFRQEAAYAKTHKDLPVGIYFGAGVLEATDPDLEGMGEIVSGMSHLAGTLATRHYPGLKTTIEYHPGMGHMDVMGTSAVRGLRTLYAK